MPTGIWKVRGEEKYFKKLNGKDWGEFAYGRQVFSFKFVKNDGDDVVLVKTDGSYLKLTSSQLLMGWGEDDYNRTEYYGSWVSRMSGGDDSGNAWDSFTSFFSSSNNNSGGACSRTTYRSGGG